MNELTRTTTASRLFFRSGPGWVDIEGRERAALSGAEQVVAAASRVASRPTVPVASASAPGAFRSQDRYGIGARPSAYPAATGDRTLFLRSGPLWRDQGGGPGRLRAVLNEIEKGWRDVAVDGGGADRLPLRPETGAPQAYL